ncbi:MAG: FAD-dependent 5-carboxymethylaminomethyl-2-thiouridine(34) oxidoreductase MnmC [Rhizobacter sp.]
MSKAVDEGSATAASALAAALPTLWRNRARFIVLDDRFDGGQGFQLILMAWRNDPDRCAQLHVITASPDIAEGCMAGTLNSELDDEIAACWPPITPNLHRLTFDGGRVQWMLVPTPLDVAMRELLAEVDVFACTATVPADEHAARRQARALARLACSNARVYLGAASADEPMRHALQSAGFAPLHESGAAGRSDGRLEGWHYAPPFSPRHGPIRSRASAQSTAPVLIVGAGLAGCAMAWALAEQGRDCIVFERHRSPAMETSGNLAGLFHGIVNPQDGAHARFNRAAALETQRAVAIALAQHRVAGSVQGLLRLETGSASDPLRSMQAKLIGMGLPSSYVQALSAQEASSRCGLNLQQPAWWYPGGGWVQPGGLVRSFLERAGRRASLRAGCLVESLERASGTWELRDERGALLAASDVVVLANAGDALRLLQPLMPGSQPQVWPLLQVRGQISTVPAAKLGELTLPGVPVTGAGYLLPEVDGLAIFGATSQVGDDDPAVRDSDHRHNLDQLARLTGIALRIDTSDFGGRTGWRWTTNDRLPVLGAVPDPAAAMRAPRLEQPAQVPRLRGLYACTAFGSRGITWAALAAQVVAASITGAPMPIEAGLLDSVDAARFVVRDAARRFHRGG